MKSHVEYVKPNGEITYIKSFSQKERDVLETLEDSRVTHIKRLLDYAKHQIAECELKINTPIELFQLEGPYWDDGDSIIHYELTPKGKIQERQTFRLDNKEEPDRVMPYNPKPDYSFDSVGAVINPGLIKGLERLLKIDEE